MEHRELRLQEEHELIVTIFPEVIRDGDWFLLPDDPRATRLGWTPDPFSVAFRAQPGHPGQVPYGIYVPSSAQVHGCSPENFTANANDPPPFAGQWGVLSWQGDADGMPWVARQAIREGANLLNYLFTFQERFKQGV